MSKIYTKAERITQHKMFAALLSHLENKQIKHNGKDVSYVLHPLTKRGLIESGWTQEDISDLEESIFIDAEKLNNCEVSRSVPKNLFYELQKVSQENTIFENQVVSIPNDITNALVCGELLKCFSEEDLIKTGIFVKIRDFDIDGKTCEAWRIDIDGRLSRNGFLVPLFDKDKLITGLRVFRHFNDERPFTLRTRSSFIDYTKGKYE